MDEEFSSAPENIEPELNHSDKAVGMYGEPSSTFEKMSYYPPRTIDWLLPMFILFILIGLTNIILMRNDEIAYQTKQQQREKVQETFDAMVENGQLTREQADEQIDKANERMEQGQGTVGIVIVFLSIIVGGFIFFFFMAAIYFLFAKFIFKGEGSFSSALVAAGLPAYITMIQVIIAAILSFAFERLIQDTSAAALLNVDRSSLTGWFLAKIDPVSIWAYAVVSIGLAKMFRSVDKVKYFILVFGLWIIGSFLFYLLAQAIPILKAFR
jgi:hypothetical protein